MADDFQFLDELGITESDVAQPQSVYQEFILQLANKITEDLREATSQKARNTGALAQSIAYFPTGEMSFEIKADDYFSYVDEGVNAVGTNNYGSRFSFQYPGVSHNMAKAIQEWKGMEIGQAYATAYNIKQRGIKPRNIVEDTINDDVLTRIASDLAAVTGLLFEITFTKNTKTWQ